MALAVPLPAIAASGSPKASEWSLDALRAADVRVLSVGYRLATANAPFCRAIENAAGMTLHHIGQYPDAAAARATFGFAGDYAVLALVDTGWPVAVIDNLTTGFSWAVHDGVPFYEGDIEDAALVARIVADQGIRAIMHFAGSIVVPESVVDPLKYYHNNTGKTRALTTGRDVRHVLRRGRRCDRYIADCPALAGQLASAPAVALGQARRLRP